MAIRVMGKCTSSAWTKCGAERVTRVRWAPSTSFKSRSVSTTCVRASLNTFASGSKLRSFTLPEETPMKGDFTGIRRWPAKHYASVRMQQGRVQLDSDWNDQIEIQEHLDRSQALDVIGPAGGPKGENGGFRVELKPDGTDLTISPGRFWLGGLLCA